METERTEHKIPAWLQKIQDNSSELELLVSGGAIFALFQLSNLANNFITQIQINSGFGGLNEFLILIQLFLNVLIVGFVLHLILRGYWLSLVCLNYVFPKGIKWENIKRTKPFKMDNVKRNDLYNQIITADRLCGMCMYVAVLCSVSIFGFVVGTLLITGLGLLIGNVVFGKLFILVISNLFFIYYLDFFASGILRRIPYISYCIFPFFYLFDIITLRFLTQRSLLLFDSNNRILKLVLVAIFLIVGFLLSIEALKEKFYWGSVGDKKEIPKTLWERDRKNKESQYRENIRTLQDAGLYISQIRYKDEMVFPFYNKAGVIIESKKIESNFLELEILHTVLLDQYCKENNIDVFANLFEIKINNSTYNNLDWLTWKQSNYSGIKTLLDIKDLEHGKNTLAIYIDSMLFAESLFWFDRLKAQKES